jgi:hypothetical protein
VKLGAAALAVVLALAGTGCDSGHHARAHKRAQEPVVYVTSLTSPNGKRIAVVTHNGSYLEVGPAGGGHRRVVYRASEGGISADVYWASNDLIAFGDGDFEIDTIDLRTRRVQQLATATSFTISPDGRWIAFSRTDGPETPDTVGVVRTTGGMCLVPPRPANRQDTGAFMKRGVKRLFFLRSPFSAAGGASGSGGIISMPLSGLRRTPTACG